ncbi:hypothetical protein P4Y54_000127 [Acinetobacter baumannii]|nr:hypothetical protein [Acinetobacter baumannii]
MSLILKSDKVATKSLGNINGLMDQDFVLFLDFENEHYFKKSNGVATEITLAEAVSYSKDNSNLQKTMLKDGSIQNQSLTAPRFWKVSDASRFGMLVEENQPNYFINPFAPVTQNITLPAGTKNVTVQCKGSGSVTVSGPDISTVIVSENSPATIQPQGGTWTQLTVTVSGSLEYVGCFRTSGINGLKSQLGPNPGIERPKINADLMSLLSGTSEFTVVMQHMPIKRLPDSRDQPEIRFHVKTSTYNIGLGINERANASAVGHRVVAVRLSDTSSVISNGTYAGYTHKDNRNIMSQVFNINNSKVRTAIAGGALTTINHTVTDLINSIQELHLGGRQLTSGGLVQEIGSNCIYTKVAIFKKSFTDAELISLSKSWL